MHKVDWSVTVTVYAPAVNPVIVCVVWPPGLHEYENGPKPPVTPTVAVPSLPPKQVELIVVMLAVTAELGSVMVIVSYFTPIPRLK